LATLVHATSITTPIVAMTTHSTLPTLPTTCSFKGRNAGVIFHGSKKWGSVPGPFVHESIQTLSRRATSASACEIVTPGRSLPMPWYAKPASDCLTEGRRHQQIEVVTDHLESARHHTGDHARLGVNTNGATHHARISAEAPLPVSITEHHALRSAWNLICCS
jgi:hypothetical protein